MAADIGFHPGELAVQRRAGVREEADRLSRMLGPARLGGGIAAFLGMRTFAVITARDAAGRLWTSPLAGPPGFLEVTGPTTLAVHASPAEGDPLSRLPSGQQAGLVVIEFSARRRVRLNGVLAAAADGTLTVEVEQAYGNCPQYIRPRVLRPDEFGRTSGSAVRQHAALSPPEAALVRAADTFFLGTVNPERGGDASHRGGPAGFVRVTAGGDGLWWPDYPGNNLFNSFGNLAVDPEAALLFLDFGAGRTLQLSGRAEVDWDAAVQPGDDGRTGRRVAFAVERVAARGPFPSSDEDRAR
ncbi:MAG TPA: pyridoxamine 5'-phosphate oxidase family protein [Trebonia sp.]